MADYDIGVLALVVPSTSGPKTTYRPAVSVRNNGIHDALASGYLRTYAVGLMVFETELYSPVIHAGETGNAQATEYWTPATEGTYVIHAYLTTPLDQVEANNMLPPTTIIITGAPIPPEPPVQFHASQHEEGGADELIVDGLHGTLKDAQPAQAHRASHQAAGADQLDVTGLPGILAEGQPIRDHHSDHEDGGTDELNVDELSGVLKNLQKPKVHANEAHDPNYSAKPHGNADHDPNFSPDPHNNQYHDPPMMSLSGAAYIRDVDAPPPLFIDSLTTGTPLDATLPPDYLQDNDLLFLELSAYALLVAGGQPSIELQIKHAAGEWHTLTTLNVPEFSADASHQLLLTIRGSMAVYSEQGSHVLQPVIECDFFRDQAELPPNWYRTRNPYYGHQILTSEAQHIRLRYTTPAGAGSYTVFVLSTLSRARPNHPE